MPDDTYGFDYETMSKCDIRLGAYRYSSDPSTRILMFAISKNGEPPLVWDYLRRQKGAFQMLKEAIGSGALIYAFNAMFECAVSFYRMLEDIGLEPPAIEQWRCTRVMTLRAAIPASLAGAAQILGVQDKDKAGKDLIRIFSDLTKEVTLTKGKEKMKVTSPLLESPIPWDWTVKVGGEEMTVRQAWEGMIAYCSKDVEVENDVRRKLRKFELEGFELEGFQFDLRMNHRGVPINRDALTHAKEVIELEGEDLRQQFEAITGLQPTQTAKFLTWMKCRGYEEDNMQAATMEKALEESSPVRLPSEYYVTESSRGVHVELRPKLELAEEARKALSLRASMSFAAVKKIPAMLETACPDGRMRGLFTFHGAQRTGRWTSHGPQLQNAKKPTIDEPDAAYADICAKTDRDLLKMFYGSIHETCASCVRNFVQPESGELLDLDLANIESRVGSWIAGCDADLDLYREKRDAYKELASKIFGVGIKDVTKDQRFVAKIGILSLCFQVGPKTFFETCATWGMPISKKIALETVKTFRGTKPEFPSTWKAFERAAIDAINEPGQWFEVNDKVAFACSKKSPFDRLIMRLPSGRQLIYPAPKVERKIKRHVDFDTGEKREWETDEISFYGAIKGHAGWGRVSTYAGDLFQSSVQGTARDVMLHGCLEAEKRGYNIFSIIHDEAISEDGDLQGYLDAFCTIPSWMPKDFPLAAEADRIPYYKK